MEGRKAATGFLVSQNALWDFGARRGGLGSVAALLGEQQPFGDVRLSLKQRTDFL